MIAIPRNARSLAVILILSVSSLTPSWSQIVKVDSTTNWKKALRMGMNLNQASFTSNWKTGGVNSLGINVLFNFKANYKKGKTSWDNQIDLLYGMVNNEGQGYRKTNDRIFLDTKVGHALSDKWDLFSAVNVQSQFARGYKYEKDAAGVEQTLLTSDPFAPTFITLSLGGEYHPADYFTLRISPIAPRLTLLHGNDGRYAAVDPLKPYGVLVGEDTRFEWFAFQLMAEFIKDIAPNMNLRMRYIMFANYQTLEANKVDHRLDLNLVAKVNKFVNVSIGGIFLYDFDQDISPQYSESLSLGILYTFQNFEDKK